MTSKMEDVDFQDLDECVADDAVDLKEISVGLSFFSFKEVNGSFERIKKSVLCIYQPIRKGL